MVLPNFEAGFFFLLLGLALFLTFTPFKEKTVKTGFKILAMSLFFILAIYTIGGYQVAFTINNNQTLTNIQTNETWHEVDNNQNVILPGGENSSLLGYLFVGFAMMNFALAVYGLFGKQDKDKK